MDVVGQHIDNGDKLIDTGADLLSEGKVISCHQGRMEFGFRVLEARSIISDPCDQDMQSVMNLKIKYRESFRFWPYLDYEKK